MEQLKGLRTAQGLTQEQLAEMLKTTQQTVARWETGKSEPSIATLKDLALIFGTSVDDLLGCNPFGPASKGEVVTNRHHYFAKSDEGFWGHLGIRVPGATKSIWYPITLGEADRISRRIADTTSKAPWIVATTLNNRALVINMATVPQLSMLDDNADEVADDWELGWDRYQGFSPEIYRGIEDHFLGFDDDDVSEAFSQTIEEVIRQEGLDQGKVFALLRATRVHYNDGTLRELCVDDDTSWSTFSAVEYDNDSLTFDLSDRDSGLDVFVARSQVVMVDMPLHRMSDAAKRELEELEREEAASVAAEAVKKANRASQKGAAKKKKGDS